MKHFAAIALLIAVAACSNGPNDPRQAYETGYIAGVEAQKNYAELVSQDMSKKPKTAATKAWVAKNAFWFLHPNSEFNREMRAKAIEIDNSLAAQGYRSDEEHYRRLDTLLNLWVIGRVPAICEETPQYCKKLLKERQAILGPAY